jgi:hypothetical protein
MSSIADTIKYLWTNTQESYYYGRRRLIDDYWEVDADGELVGLNFGSSWFTGGSLGSGEEAGDPLGSGEEADNPLGSGEEADNPLGSGEEADNPLGSGEEAGDLLGNGEEASAADGAGETAIDTPWWFDDEIAYGEKYAEHTDELNKYIREFDDLNEEMAEKAIAADNAENATTGISGDIKWMMQFDQSSTEASVSCEVEPLEEDWGASTLNEITEYKEEFSSHAGDDGTQWISFNEAPDGMDFSKIDANNDGNIDFSEFLFDKFLDDFKQLARGDDTIDGYDLVKTKYDGKENEYLNALDDIHEFDINENDTIDFSEFLTMKMDHIQVPKTSCEEVPDTSDFWKDLMWEGGPNGTVFIIILASLVCLAIGIGVGVYCYCRAKLNRGGNSTGSANFHNDDLSSTPPIEPAPEQGLNSSADNGINDANEHQQHSTEVQYLEPVEMQPYNTHQYLEPVEMQPYNRHQYLEPVEMQPYNRQPQNSPVRRPKTPRPMGDPTRLKRRLAGSPVLARMLMEIQPESPNTPELGAFPGDEIVAEQNTESETELALTVLVPIIGAMSVTFIFYLFRRLRSKPN